MPWLTPTDDRLPGLWAGAADLDVDTLALHLEAARDDIAAFGPPLPNPADPPAGWVIGQALQAQARARAAEAGPADQLGGFGQSVTVFPLDWTVRQLVRPKRGKPTVR